MAKILFTAFMADARGKVAGSVFARNGGGAYVRTKVTPLNPQTNAQSIARTVLAGFSQGWRALSEAARGSWNDMVAQYKTTNVFGNNVTPTGKNLYTRLNAILASVGVAPLTFAPMPEEVAAFTSFGFTFDGTTGNIVLDFAPTIPASTAVQVWATPPQSPGKYFVKSEYRLITVMPSATTTGEDIQEAYTERFGGVAPVGSKVFVRVVPVNTNTGQTGTGLEAGVIRV